MVNDNRHESSDEDSDDESSSEDESDDSVEEIKPKSKPEPKVSLIIFICKIFQYLTLLKTEFLKFIGPRGQKIMRSANNVGNAGPHVRQTFFINPAVSEAQTWGQLLDYITITLQFS